MTYIYATSSPPRFQFEVSSGTLNQSQVWNCGPTCVAKIADYYRDYWFGIEAGRYLLGGMGPYNVNGDIVYGAPPSMPTNAWQQRDMLQKRGVPCEVYGVPSVEALRNLVSGGKRPILLGLNFARVPDSIAGHPFQGWHAIVVLNTATSPEGARGFLVNDPNFAPGSDPSRGKRFYPESTMAYALSDPETNWAVVPLSPKNTQTPLTEAQEMAIMANIEVATGRWFNCKAVTLRKGPGTNYPKHFTMTQPDRFWLAGFAPNDWVMASRGPGHKGFFFVPPNH